MILADKIIELRKKNGWSQEDLAEKLSVSRQAISKWESAQSVPDMNKIIKMSDLFGVSTDFLLRDEYEIEPDKESRALTAADLSDVDCELRSVSMEEATSFLDARENASRWTALGVLLCILSPIVLILMGGLSEYGKISLQEEMAAGAGLVALFLLVGPAVAMFIKINMALDPYEYLETELLDTEYGVDGMARSRKERFHDTYARMMTIGIVLCVISALPIFITMMIVGEPGEGAKNIYYVFAICELLALVAVGVFLIVRASMIQGGFDIILEEGDYTRKAKTENKRNKNVTAVYWMAVTAIYLGYSFITNRWDRSWIIWAVAGVSYGIVIVIANALRKKS